MTEAVLCVSFGTSVPQARESIQTVEETLKAAAGERIFTRALTSRTIRRILAGRGEEIPGVDGALAALAAQGVERVVVQPTHLLAGHEYDKIRREMDPWAGRFSSLELGRPLLADTGDVRALAAALCAACPPEEGEALVLFGHGTDHPANLVYPALQTAFRLLGREDVWIGTVEGWPGLEELSAQLARQSRRRLHLLPLMLVAGGHAMNDMAGEGDSWKTRLEAEGYQVRCTLRGLGALPQVQALYRARLAALLPLEQ